MSPKATKYNVPALDKAIAIIETLARQQEPMGISELCKLLDIPKTSVFFILQTLEKHQYILKTPEGKYTLGYQLIHLGLSVLNKMDIRALARPSMEKLQQETGYTVHLAIFDHGEAMYVEKVEPQAFVQFSTYVGQRHPLHVTAVGKSLAAFLPEHELDEWLRIKGLPARTAKTITDIREFKEELAVVRKRGYAVEDEEGEIGIRCIGAPIFDGQSKLKAAVSVTALCSELPNERIAAVGEKVKETALDISRKLGYPLREHPETRSEVR